MIFGEDKISEEEVAAGYTAAVVNNTLNELFVAISTECPAVELTRNDGSKVKLSELVNTDSPFVVDYWTEVADENKYAYPLVGNTVLIDRIKESPVLGQIHAEANRAMSQIRQLRFINGKRNDGKYNEAIEKMQEEAEPYLKALEIASSFAEGFIEEDVDE